MCPGILTAKTTIDQEGRDESFPQVFCMWPPYYRPLDWVYAYTLPAESYAYAQEFHYFVVVDFEATCEEGKVISPQEIIEFPSVIVNALTGQIEASFQTYVKPVYHQVLTDFCKELTGIQQNQVDEAVSLREALLVHDQWLEARGVKNTKFAVVTWTNWDCRVMLESECRFKGIRKPTYFNRWINLKLPFQEVFGVCCNLKDAVELAGLEWKGRAHSGLDDAHNTARILTHLMRQGFKFSITNSMPVTGPAVDHPLPQKDLPDNHPSCPIPQPEKPKPVIQLSCKESPTFCFCGVTSNVGVVRKPGPKQGKVFFGCGNWTASRGTLCRYFKWAT